MNEYFLTSTVYNKKDDFFLVTTFFVFLQNVNFVVCKR